MFWLGFWSVWLAFLYAAYRAITLINQPEIAAEKATLLEQEYAPAEGTPPQQQHKKQLLPRLFPATMPVESCRWINLLLEQGFAAMQVRDAAATLCDALNKEFTALEERSKFLVTYPSQYHSDVQLELYICVERRIGPLPA
jgi:hypothetical protein